MAKRRISDHHVPGLFAIGVCVLFFAASSCTKHDAVAEAQQAEEQAQIEHEEERLQEALRKAQSHRELWHGRDWPPDDDGGPPPPGSYR